MRVSIASASLIFVWATLAVAQTRSDKHAYDLMGPVKVVRETRVYFDYQDGKYSELPSREPEKAVKVFDRDGTLLYSEVLSNLLPCSFSRFGSKTYYIDPSKRVYDSKGNLIEYMPNETFEHSGYRPKHFYDAKGRLIETEHYDPYTLRYKWLYSYEKDDEFGNWTARTVTPLIINTNYDRLSKREEYRTIAYY